MTLGNFGGCIKISEDDSFVLYEYFSCNWFLGDYEKVFDGLILIKKSALIEPERREKFRRMPSGKRRKFIKFILREVPLYELIDSGDVQIENCSHAWKFLPNGVDIMAYRICIRIFEYYQLEGTLPEKSSWLN